MPKPPPTSGLVTRTAASSSPNALAIQPFMPQTPCPPKARCSRSPSHSAKAPRGSIELTMMRLSSSREADAAGGGGEGRLGRRLVAQRPVVGHVAGRLGMDLRPAGRKLHMDRQIGGVEGDRLDRVAGLRDGFGHHRCDRLADKRTRSLASTGRSGAAAFVPSLFFTVIQGIAGSTPAASRSAAPSTRWTPGIPRASSRSSAVISACATGLRRNITCSPSAGATSST